MPNEQNQKKDVAAILEDDVFIDRALQKAARRAIEEHKAEGLPLAMWRDGKPTWISAEELEAKFDSDPT